MTKLKENSGKPESKDKLVEIGSEMTGSAIGAALGLLAIGPIGAVGGAIAAPVITHTLNYIGMEFKNRFISSNEDKRIGTALEYAIKMVQEGLDKGREIRADIFCQERSGERIPAEEILEGILLSAQREYEELKIKYYGILWANYIFNPGIDKEMENLLIKISQNLSFRQLCILAIFANASQYHLREKNYRGEGLRSTDKVVPLLQEIYDLSNRGLLAEPQGWVMGLSDINPSKLETNGMGHNLYVLMGLNAIENVYLDPIVRLLEH